MAKQEKPWIFGPARRNLSGTVKDEVDTKAADLIENVLKPQHNQTPPEGYQLNSLVDIKTKWLGSKCYFISVYRTPRPRANSFETKFARMEYVGNAKFDLSFMRHTGRWVELYERLTVDECMKAIKDDPWFVPWAPDEE
jgi:hypothetical protein